MRIISDRNSRRSKGIAYVEFTDRSAVPLVSFAFFLDNSSLQFLTISMHVYFEGLKFF